MHRVNVIVQLMIILVVVFDASGTQLQDDLSNQPLSALLAVLPIGPDQYVGDVGLHPICEEIQRRIRQGELTENDWRSLIVKGGVINWRKRWPTDQPFQIEVDVPAWARSSIEFRVKSTVSQEHLTIRAGRTWTAPCGLAANSMANKEPKEEIVDRFGTIAELKSEMTSVDVDVEVRTGGFEHFPTDYWADAETLFHGTVSLSVEAVDSIDESIKLVSEDNVDVAFQEALHIRVYPHTWADRSEHVYLLVAFNRIPQTAIENLGLGLNIHILRDDQVVEQVKIAGPGFWEWTAGLFQSNHLDLLKLKDRYGELTGREYARWSIQVSGDPVLALSDWNFNKVWAGEFTLPLSDVIESQAPVVIGGGN